MRLLELGRIVAQAEALRLRRFTRRQTTRALFAVVAGIFGIGLLVSLHVAGALALVPRIGALYATLIVAAVDLLIAAVCAVLAARDVPDRIEAEAKLVSREARAQMAEAAVVSALVVPTLRRAGFGIASRMLGGKRAR